MDLRRRNFLSGAAATLAAPSIARAAVVAGSNVGPGRLWLLRLGVNEELNIRLQHDTRDEARLALAELSWFFRDWKDNDQALWIDPNLPHVLAELQISLSDDYGSPRLIEVTSGYRTPERNSTLPGAVADSFHIKGRAGDIIVPGYHPTRVGAFASKTSAGGIGTYPNFTHVDTGPRRYW